ncbi:hypothetical protein MASR1M66_11530 [Aminivibrio sp.]
MAPIGRVAGLLLQYYTASRRLAALDEIMKKPTAVPRAQPPSSGNIEFSGVTFSYPEQERRLALSNVSFRIEEGEKVAFIGRSARERRRSAGCSSGSTASGGICSRGRNGHPAGIDPSEPR